MKFDIKKCSLEDLKENLDTFKWVNEQYKKGIEETYECRTVEECFNIQCVEFIQSEFLISQIVGDIKEIEDVRVFLKHHKKLNKKNIRIFKNQINKFIKENI